MGQLIPAGPNTASYPMDPNNMAQITAWMQGAAAAYALRQTNADYQTWVTGPFGTWLNQYEAARATLPPPSPPLGFSAQMSDDNLSYSLVSSGQPSGPIPPFAILPPPMIPVSGLNNGVTPIPMFIAPIGGRVTQQDGTVWMRLS